MNLSDLTGGLGNIKDELTGEIKNLGEEVIEGKTTPTDALHEGEEKAIESIKGMFGFGEEKPATDEASDDTNAADESESNDNDTESADDDSEEK